MNVTELAKSYYGYNEKTCNEFERAAKRTLMNTRGDIPCDKCKKPWCCNQYLTGTLFEGIVLAGKIGKNQPQAAQAAMASQQAVTQAKLLKSIIAKHKGELFEEAYMPIWDTFTKSWMDERHSCAFLTEGRCSIYEYRPFVCRAYFVACEPELCNPSNSEFIPVLNHMELMASVMETEIAFLEQVFGEGALAGIPMPLGYAIHFGRLLLTRGLDTVHLAMAVFAGDLGLAQLRH